MRIIDEIIIHCSATPEGRDVTVDDIRNWHNTRGWNDIGYHYVVTLDGGVHEGRPVAKIGAHCKGHNRQSIGVCYVGGLDRDGHARDTRTREQKAALETLLRRLLAQFPAITRISGHHDYAARDCPCFPARYEYRHLLTPATARAVAPKEVDAVLADADKPLGQSKTVWGALLAGASSVLTSLGDLPESVSFALIAVGVGAAIFIIWDRRRKARLAHLARVTEAG